MKKKIGLLTLPLIDNYGGIIQIAALNHFLCQNGQNPILLDRKFDQSKYVVFMKFLFENNPFYKIYDFRKYRKRKLFLTNIHLFIDEYIPNKTRAIYNNDQLISITKDIETFIVGSDQVWRYQYIKKNYLNFFFDFVPNGKRIISYAASFGNSFWEGDKESLNKIKVLLNRFDFISVREYSGKLFCKNELNIPNVQHVLDPTFLPNIDFYNGIIDKENLSGNIGLFNYVLDDSKDKNEIINKIGQFFNLKIDSIYLDEELKGINNSKKKPSIGEWLYNFKNAEYVITDSFHGMVFSILFNKQFIALGNNKRGLDRFQSLLKLFDLEERLLVDSDYQSILTKKIDYTEVNKKINSHKEKSIYFLLNALEK